MRAFILLATVSIWFFLAYEKGAACMMFPDPLVSPTPALWHVHVFGQHTCVKLNHSSVAVNYGRLCTCNFSDAMAGRVMLPLPPYCS